MKGEEFKSENNNLGNKLQNVLSMKNNKMGKTLAYANKDKRKALFILKNSSGDPFVNI